MKKIITAAMIAAMAGSLFAEVKISTNFRIRPVIVQNDSGTEAASKTTWSSLDNGQNKNAQEAKDTIKFTAKNDYAGVTTELNVSGTEKYNVNVSNYNAFVKFGSSFTLTGGILDSRYANRVTKDQNNLSLLEQNWGAKGLGYGYVTYTDDFNKKDGKTYAKLDNSYVTFSGNKKLGVNPNMFAALNSVLSSDFYSAFTTKEYTKPKNGKDNSGTPDTLSVIGADSDNITAIEGTKVLSFVADYLLSDVAGGDLQFWAAMNKADSEWTTTNDDGETTAVVNSRYAFRAAYSNDDFAIDADFHIGKEQFILAAFISPKMVENLTATAGFTFAKDNSGDDGSTFYAIDARARYAATDALALTLMLNYSNAKIEDADAVGVLDTVLNGTYKINDIASVFGEAEFVFNTNSDMKDLVGHQLAVQGGAILTAGKGATVEFALRDTLVGIGYDDETSGGLDVWGNSFSVPVVMRVKL